MRWDRGYNGLSIKRSGQNVTLTFDNLLASSNNSDQSFLQIVEIQDGQGVTQILHLQIVDENSKQMSWIPSAKGNYQVRTFMIDGLDNPNVMTSVKTSAFTIFE